MGEIIRHKPALVELDQRILPSFTPLSPFFNGLDATVAAATVADFNHDGRDDVAVYNNGDGGPSVSILLSQGNGQFTQSQLISTPNAGTPNQILTADFNGDGIPDLATASGLVDSSATQQALTVYLGNGDGTFTQSFIDPTPTLGIGIGDFNGDGHPDLVAIQPGQYQIYLGTGTGQFTTLPPVASTLAGAKILTGDIDGNGTIDFVGIDPSGNIETALGKGDGTFGPPVITLGSGRVTDFVLGDFDGDGRLDVVDNESPNSGSDILALHSNIGGGSFQSAGISFYSQSSSGISVASTDFDSNGQPDVVTDDVFQNAGLVYRTGTTFTADAQNPYPAGSFPQVLVTGDFDGDHHPDFLILGSGDGSSQGVVFLNDLPDPTTTTLTVSPEYSLVGTPLTLTATVALQYPGANPSIPQGSVTFSDESGPLGTETLTDGIATLTDVLLPEGPHEITATYSGSAATIGSNGYGVPFESALVPSASSPAPVQVVSPPAPPPPPPPPPPPCSCALKVDKPEFVVGTDNGPVVCYRNGDGQATGAFGSFSAPFPGVRPALGDFNGDGVSDVVGGSGPGITAQVTIDDGATKQPILTVQPFDGFQGGVFVACADFNGDGVADFAVGADAGGEPRVCVYLTLDGQLVQVASFFAFDEGFRGGVRLAAGDINGDGTPDLIVGAGPGAGPAVAVFDGKELIHGVAKRLINDFYAYDAGFRGGVYVAAGDVNADGDADIITGAGIGAPHVTVVSGASLMDRDLQRLASFYAADPSTQGGIRVAARDLDGDGYSDVIAGAGVGNGSTVWSFSGLSITETGSAPSRFAEEAFPGLYAGVYVG